jgi:hypothetical protein
MKKILISMLIGANLSAVEPESSTTTQVKEQIQRIEIPSHVKGLRIVNNNTLRWDDTLKPLPAPSHHEYYSTRPAVYQAALVPEGLIPARWQRTVMGGLVVATAYAVMRAYVYLLAKELDKASHWWHWKSELSLAALTELPEKELAHELSLEIQERYSKKVVRDVAFIMPLVHFIQDTNYEQEYLEHLITVYIKLDAWGMQNLFAADEEIMQSARLKLARLNFIRQLYMKWLSSYAVDVPVGA